MMAEKTESLEIGREKLGSNSSARYGEGIVQTTNNHKIGSENYSGKLSNRLCVRVTPASLK